MFKAITEVPEGFAVISACGLNQVGYEDVTLKHGVFTHFLLEGIKGKADANNDRIVTINELYDYLTPNVKDWVFKVFNASQIPHLRSNFGGVYVLSKLPPETPKTEDTVGTELFIKIYLWQSSYEMELIRFNAEGIDSDLKDTLEASIEKILLVLRKEYGMGGLIDNDSTIDFKDGSVIRQKNEDEKRSLLKLAVGVSFNYNKERWSTIDNLILELDNLSSSWKRMSLVTLKKFDFASVEKLCTDNGYEIVGLTLKPKSITFKGKLFSDNTHSICIKEFDDHSVVYVEGYYYPNYLEDHFYALANPKKVSEILAKAVIA